MKQFTQTYKSILIKKNSNQSVNKKFKTLINQENKLTMQIFDEQTNECYDLVIDDCYLMSRQDLLNFFTTPLDIHYTLVQLKDQVILTEDYRVILNLNLNASKVNITKQFIFQLRINLEKTLMQQRQKINGFDKQVRQLYNQLDIQKERNKQKGDSLFLEISQLKKQKNMLKYKLDQATVEIERLNALLLQKENQTYELKRCVQQKKQEISSRESTEYNTKSRVIELEQTIKTLELTKMKKEILMNQTNPHYYLFHYLHTKTGTIKIKKIGPNGWTNFISNALLPQSQSNIFQMKVNTTKDGSIAMGICNNLAFGSSDIDSPLSLTYFVHDGRLFQKGSRRLSGPPISIGQTLKLQINWNSNILVWYNGETKVGESQMDSTFKLNNIFLIARLFWKQDQIELK